MKNNKRYNKKEEKLSNLLASISRTCSNCGSLRINFASDIFIEHLNKNEKEEGMKSCIKICQKCGRIDFFAENILRKFLADMKKNPNKYYKMRGEGVLKAFFNPILKFVDKILFIKDIVK